MEEKIAIVGMEVMQEDARGLDGFEQNLYDGIFPSRETGRPILPAGSALEGVISGAAGDTRSKAGEEERTPPLVLACRAGVDPRPGADRSAFFVEEDLFAALEKAASLLIENGETSVILAASAPWGGPESVALKSGTPESNALKSGAPESNELKSDVPKSNGTETTAPLTERHEGAAVMLKLLSRAKADKDRIYAVIDKRDRLPRETSDPAKSGALCGRAFESASPDPSEIGYLHICGTPLEDLIREPGFADIPAEGPNRLSCALGADSGRYGKEDSRSFGNLGCLLGFIRTSLSLYHRYIPGTPDWNPPADPEPWEKSRFYIPARSKTWFLPGGTGKRRAALFCPGDNGLDHITLSEDPELPFRSGKYLARSTPFSFPIAGENEEDLLAQLDRLEKELVSGKEPEGLAIENFSEFKQKDDAVYALMLIGATKDELLKEIRFLSKGIGRAFAAGTGPGTELKTPRGSFFTANPLGRTGKVVFVYPGVGSAYMGLGQDLFHMFPGVYDGFAGLAPDVGSFLKERELYPRTWYPLTEERQKTLARELRKGIMDISECGISFSVIFTMIMAGYFKLFPDLAMGYSMGEASMMASLMVWQDPGQMSGRLKEYDVFSHALSGELTAVRKSWGLPAKGTAEEQIWESYTLLADRKEVEEAVSGEDRVYITLVNTDTEVVIAGDPESCVRVAERIGCRYFPLRLDLAIHSEPSFNEYDNLVDLFTLPVGEKSGIRFYSSSCYLPVPIRSKAVAHSIARAFCDPVDFPRLVRKAHQDGGRIFIEVGPRNICSLWTDEILAGEDYTAVSLNQKGTRDQVSLVRGLAQLVGHRVNVDLSPLFKFGRG